MNNIKSILLEATEYTDGASLAKAILRGQIAGISKKFFNGEEPNTEALDKFLQTIKANFNKPLQNKVIVLLLNKAKIIDNLKHIDNQIIDATKSYFDNINKEEAKKPEVKELFDKFEEANLTDSFNKTFENEINKIFEDYAEMKSDDEYEVIYPTDSDGWEVVVPKTFGAAKYLSSFKGIGKAYWCTASHAESFKKYTKNDNKLYIIRNVKKSILYQMDWGYQYKWTEPSFQNFHNKQISVNTAIEKIPEKVLDAIKNRDGISAKEFLMKYKNTLEKNGENKTIVDGWNYKELSPKEFLEIVKKYHINISYNKIVKPDISDALKDYGIRTEKNKYIFLANGERNFLYIYSLETLYTKQNNEIDYPLYELIKDDTGYKSKKLDSTFFMNKEIPVKIKKIFFKNKELEKPNYKVFDYIKKGNRTKTNVYELKNPAALKFVSGKMYNWLKVRLEEFEKAKNSSGHKKEEIELYKLFNSKRPFSALYCSKKQAYNNSFEFLLVNSDEPFMVIDNRFNHPFKIISDKREIGINLSIAVDKSFIKDNFPSLYNRLFNDQYNSNVETLKKAKDYKNEYFLTPFFVKDDEKYYYLEWEKEASYFYDKFKDKYHFKSDGDKIILNNIVKVDKNKNVINVSKEEAEKLGIVSRQDDKIIINGEEFTYRSLSFKIAKENVNTEKIKIEKEKSLAEIKSRIRGNIKNEY